MLNNTRSQAPRALVPSHNLMHCIYHCPLFTVFYPVLILHDCVLTKPGWNTFKPKNSPSKGSILWVFLRKSMEPSSVESLTPCSSLLTTGVIASDPPKDSHPSTCQHVTSSLTPLFLLLCIASVFGSVILRVLNLCHSRAQVPEETV